MSLQGCSLQESSRQRECFDQARDRVNRDLMKAHGMILEIHNIRPVPQWIN